MDLYGPGVEVFAWQEEQMGLDSNRPQEEPRLNEERLSVFDRRVIQRHVLFSLAVVLMYLVLNRPEVIMVSQLGFTVWFPAMGLVLAVMLGISPRYFLLTVFADLLAG